MNYQIVPAILERRLSAIDHKMRRVSGLVPVVQVDICDGQFVSSKTYASSGNKSSLARVVTLARTNKLGLELDMMVNFDCPRCMARWCQSLASANPQKVVFHVGSTYRWGELFQRIRQSSLRNTLQFTCGLAIRIDTPRAEVRKILAAHSEFSYIQIMGIKHIGRSGEKLSLDLYDYVKKIKRAFPDYPIQIDGGVKEQYIESLLTAGAGRLGMNSGLFKSTNFKKILA